ncbi:MAG: T9SS type A sorting domain-containing protein [Candidatus Cloacimonas sp.]|nr:T9SS type A sorting domain-containing protein [Candidatus Cloacimonas sp.]
MSTRTLLIALAMMALVALAWSQTNTGAFYPAGSLNEEVRIGDQTTPSYSEADNYIAGGSAGKATADAETFPIVENFEGATFPPTGWITRLSSSRANWISSSPGYNSQYMARLGTNHTNSATVILYTPAITFSGTRYRISFWLYRTDASIWSSYLRLIINTTDQATDSTEIAALNTIYTFAPAEPAAGWYQYSYIINTNPNDVRYIGFKGTIARAGVFVSIDDVMIEELPDFPQGEGTALEDITIAPSEDLSHDSSINETSPIITDLPNYATLGNLRVVGLSGTGNNVNIQVTAPAGNWYGSIYYAGAWHSSVPVFISEADDPRVFTFSGVDFTAKEGEVAILLSEGEVTTLPVELSFFDAITTAQSFVALTWVSESESQMLGYRVYRNESSDINSATMITPIMIGATNTSTQVTYRHEDREVALNTTYYYWLESVDMTSSELHGPITATVTGNATPELPTATVMSNVYPNPFRMCNNANIDVAVKAGETGTVTVYNILGQSVKTFPVTQGTQKLNWNGRDSKGNACGSGIYFYKLSTPSMNQTKKMVIVK